MCAIAFSGRAPCPFSRWLQANAASAEAAEAATPPARIRPIKRR
jgi:hypothetical protein